MLIEERFGVLLPWKDYFKRLKKSLRKGGEERERESFIDRVGEFKVFKKFSIVLSLETFFRH